MKSTHLPIDTITAQPQDLTLVALAVARRQTVCVAGEPFGAYLAVTPALAHTAADGAIRYAGNTWTITHTLSGLAVCYVDGSIKRARALARTLADTVDWSRPVADLAADPYVREAVIAARTGRTTKARVNG